MQVCSKVAQSVQNALSGLQAECHYISQRMDVFIDVDTDRQASKAEVKYAVSIIAWKTRPMGIDHRNLPNYDVSLELL